MVNRTGEVGEQGGRPRHRLLLTLLKEIWVVLPDLPGKLRIPGEQGWLESETLPPSGREEPAGKTRRQEGPSRGVDSHFPNTSKKITEKSCLKKGLIGHLCFGVLDFQHCSSKDSWNGLKTDFCWTVKLGWSWFLLTEWKVSIVFSQGWDVQKQQNILEQIHIFPSSVLVLPHGKKNHTLDLGPKKEPLRIYSGLTWTRLSSGVFFGLRKWASCSWTLF